MDEKCRIMEAGIKRVLLLVDATIGNNFMKNEELVRTIVRMEVATEARKELLIIKNTQTCMHEELFKYFFVVKKFPRKSMKKAIKLSSSIIYMTDGTYRPRRHSVRAKLLRVKSKSVIIITNENNA